LSQINENRDRLEYVILVKSLFDRNLYASYVTLNIPIPKNNIDIKMDKHYGNAQHETSKSIVEWKMTRFNGGAEHEFRMSVFLDTS